MPRRTSPRSRRLRVEYLGKQGSVSLLLKTLGAMSPDERQDKAPKIQQLREAVADALAERKAAMEAAELEARLASETLDLSLPGARSAEGIGPPGQPGDGRAGGDLRRHGLLGRHRARDRGRLVQLHRAQHAREPPGAGDARYVLLPRHGAERCPDGKRMLLRTHTSPVQVRTMKAQGAPAPDHRAGPGLSLGQRRDAHADVPPGRRPGDRPRHPPRASQVDARDLPQGVLRARGHRAAAPAELLPVHRAIGRGRRRLRDRRTASGCSAAAATRRATAGWSCSAAAWSTAR